MKPKTSTAIRSLLPSIAGYKILDGKIEAWDIGEVKHGVPEPTQAEIDAEVIRLQAEWTANEYARNRKEEYPDMGTQFNKIYDDGIDAWKTDMVDPIKAKYPKP